MIWWHIAKGDFEHYPYKVTTGEVCSDFKTIEEAQEYCDEKNIEEYNKQFEPEGELHEDR